jgi:hypothetical protein
MICNKKVSRGNSKNYILIGVDRKKFYRDKIRQAACHGNVYVKDIDTPFSPAVVFVNLW